MAQGGIDVRRDDICLYLGPADRAKLETIVADRNSPRKWCWRAEIMLGTADGLGTNAIMRRTGKSKPCVWRWQERYIDEGVPGLLRDKSRPSRIVPLSAETKLAIIKKTATEKPANATHWSARKMAKAVGVSHRSVQRIWAGAGLKPHLVRTFKVSNDPNFAEKVVDVVGLYMNPPERALVLCVDEKSQIQALDRTQPSLPLKKGSDDDARLQAQRHYHAVCRPRREDRPGDRRMPGSPSRQGIHQLPQEDRYRCGQGARFAPHPRQLLDTQDKAGAELAEAAQALQTALHPDLFVLAQFGGAVLRLDYRGRHPPWRL